MKTAQVTSIGKTVMSSDIRKIQDIQPQVVFAFSSSLQLAKFGAVSKLAKSFPDALFVGCSTSGEITESRITDGAIVMTGLRFDDPSARIVPFIEEVTSVADSFAAGQRIAKGIDKKNLRGIFLLTPGLELNASELINAIGKEIGDSAVPITGGLAGDGTNFKSTRTILGATSYSHHVVGFCLYGDHARMKASYMGGWSPMGESMQVTQAEDNIIRKINGEPALEVYKRLIGEAAKGLPDTSLNFPFTVLKDQHATDGIVRTPLGIDKGANALILAGSVKTGDWIRLMKTDRQALVQAAGEAAAGLDKFPQGLALVVSCVGRRAVMQEQTVLEIEEVKRLIGAQCMMTGFYSYGEICPDRETQTSCLHNQTLTITHFSEVS